MSQAVKKQRKPLPKILPGSVHPQFVRCGRAGCRCAHGALHGPYFYRFWWEDRQLHKVYVKRGDVEQVQAACVMSQAQHRHRHQRRNQAESAGRQTWRELLALLREMERPDHATK